MTSHRRKTSRRVGHVLGLCLTLSVVTAFVMTPAADGQSRGNGGKANARPGAETFSHDAYAEALKYVDDRGMVYYAGLKRDRGKLDEYVRSLARLKRGVYEKWGDEDKIALWVNAYNALTLKAIIDNYPIKSSFFRSVAYPSNSIRQISGVWDELEFRVMGRDITLNDIEHKRLRARFNEPRIHMALVCAAMSCPPLRNEPYEGARLSEQLDDQAKKFLADSKKFKIDRKSNRVHLSKIFEWFGGDFVKTYKPKSGFARHDEEVAAPLNYISGHLSDDAARYLRTGKYSVKFLKYDWNLNERKSKPPPKPTQRKAD